MRKRTGEVASKALRTEQKKGGESSRGVRSVASFFIFPSSPSQFIHHIFVLSKSTNLSIPPFSLLFSYFFLLSNHDTLMFSITVPLLSPFFFFLFSLTLRGRTLKIVHRPQSLRSRSKSSCARAQGGESATKKTTKRRRSTSETLQIKDSDSAKSTETSGEGRESACGKLTQLLSERTSGKKKKSTFDKLRPFDLNLYGELFQ